MTIKQRFILALLIFSLDGKHKGHNLTEFLPPYLSIYHLCLVIYKSISSSVSVLNLHSIFFFIIIF